VGPRLYLFTPPLGDPTALADKLAAAQRAFGHRAQMNGLAALGRWTADLEKKAA